MPWPVEEVRTDTSLGLAVCRLAMGLDKLYRRARPAAGGGESVLAAEGLVPVDLWRGEPLELSGWAAAADSVAAVQSHVPRVLDPVRRAFLEDTLLSLSTFV